MQFFTTSCDASKLIHFPLQPSLVSMPCSIPCKYRRICSILAGQNKQNPFHSGPQEILLVISEKPLFCLFLLHPHPCGFVGLRILVVCILPLTCLHFWVSLILDGKNKMLTRSVILLTLSASEGSRCRAEVKGTTSIVTMPRRTQS